MPIYTYKREDDTTFEVTQKFTDEPLTVDPVTGLKCRRIIAKAPPVKFKGSGFAINDNNPHKSWHHKE
jgi:predicted nucleic acid-binding Zn ribbon protein